MRIAHSRRVALATGLAAVALLGAGCGGGDQDKLSQPAEGTSAMPAVTASTTSAVDNLAAAGAPFGPACASIPATGAGSFDVMAKERLATAVSSNPALTKLVEAINAANMKDKLDSAEGITIFAPTNDAFASADSQAISKAMADPKGQLTNLINHHVVQGRLSPDQLAGEHKTLEGTNVTVTGGGEAFMVNDASVVCGNIQTANATVYLIDKVLMPKA